MPGGESRGDLEVDQGGYLAAQVEEDHAQTLASRAGLDRNRNLLYWYERLYETHLPPGLSWESADVLEIGSGSSPLARFHARVKTSDVLELDYLDYVFDCHEIDSVSEIPDHSLDLITMTNVLHHLREPLLFLRRSARKLRRGGSVVATEPYLSALSRPIYRYLHHEPVDLEIAEPRLAVANGPLKDANTALPFLIFFRVAEWRETLGDLFDLERTTIDHFTGLAYPATGGISRRIPIPGPLYRALFAADLALSRRFPRLYSSFFTIKLETRREPPGRSRPKAPD